MKQEGKEGEGKSKGKRGREGKEGYVEEGRRGR